MGLLASSLVDEWGNLAIVFPTREALSTCTDSEDGHCRSGVVLTNPYYSRLVAKDSNSTRCEEVDILVEGLH